MSLVPFSTLPDSSRIWIFAADRKLSSSEANDLLSMLDGYLESWKAHGAPVRASRDLKYEQFVIIAADPEVTAPSGCSIDDMTHAIRSLGEKFHVEFFNTMSVFFLLNDEVRHVSRSEFRALGDRGDVTGATIVFNNAITSLREYREGAWELPARDSWHAALLPQFQHA
jgi:hypothetical protein